MRPDAIQAERHAAVRKAARAWRRGGAIDEATLKAIEAAYPDDRVRARPVFRILLFLFTLVAVTAGFGLLWFLLGEPEGAFGPLTLAFGVLMVFLTELQTGRLKRAQGGTEAATSFAAVLYPLLSVPWFLDRISYLDTQVFASIFLTASVLLLAAAAWRWGYAIYAGAAAVCLLILFAQSPGGRLLWIVVPALAAPFLLRLSEKESVAPSHRACWTAVLAVGLIGLYVAVHYDSFREGFVEDLAWGSWEPAVGVQALRWLSAAATAAVPLALLALGLRLRRRVLLIVGLGTLLISLATLLDQLSLGPEWLVITVCGAVLVAAVLVLRRWLDEAPDGERYGFTTQTLYEDLARHWEALETAAALAITPAARTVPEEQKVAGGGGEFGGGGSTGEF